MDILGRYQNGNYTVTILNDGTKIRENDLDFFNADFPESMDIKICNRCDIGCAQCHENSTPNGECGDIMSESFIDKLHPYTELAIGGGNPLEHPDLVAFLEKCKKLQLIPNMTVNQCHFERNFEFLKKLIDEKLIYGLGVSLVHGDEDFISKIKQFPNAVIHVINGVSADPIELKELSHNHLKVLILGYKKFRRGVDYYAKASEMVERKKRRLYEMLSEIIDDNWFDVVSFDNLAIEQLDVVRLMSKEDWKQFYMGGDGKATMYVDMVNREFARSSTSTDRYSLMDNIKDMFEMIRVK